MVRPQGAAPGQGRDVSKSTQELRKQAVTAIDELAQELASTRNELKDESDEKSRLEDQYSDAKQERDSAVRAISELIDAANAAALWMRQNGASSCAGRPLYDLHFAIDSAERELRDD